MTQAKKKSYRFPKNQCVLIDHVTDGSNCGFAIKGYKLRWISHTVQTAKPGRIWMTLKLSDLDPEFVKVWSERYQHLLSDGGGDTIRRREMVLSYASEEAVKAEKIKMKKLQQLQEGTINTANRNAKRGLVTDVTETTVAAAPAGI